MGGFFIRWVELLLIAYPPLFLWWLFSLPRPIDLEEMQRNLAIFRRIHFLCASYRQCTCQCHFAWSFFCFNLAWDFFKTRSHSSPGFNKVKNKSKADSLKAAILASHRKLVHDAASIASGLRSEWCASLGLVLAAPSDNIRSAIHLKFVWNLFQTWDRSWGLVWFNIKSHLECTLQLRE